MTSPGFLVQHAMLLRHLRRVPAVTRLRPLRHVRPYASATSPQPPPPSPEDASSKQQPSTSSPTPEDVLAVFEASFEPEFYESPSHAPTKQYLDVLTALPDLSIARAPNACRGCGADLQTESSMRPGYVPADVLSAAAESSIIPDAPVKDPVCQRCYRLVHYAAIHPDLRVAENGELSAAHFRAVLERLRGLNAVVVYLVDIFDFHGSFIPALRDIVGEKNPVIIAANKVDLLPPDYKASRVEAWIRHECDAMGLRDVQRVHLISSTRGKGVSDVVADAMRIAKRRRADIYVIGAANVGKSSFINQLIRIRQKARDAGKRTTKPKPVQDRPKKTRDSGGLTTSVVPGTTLDMIRIPLGSGVDLFDTPGLMMPHQLTNYLDTKDLRAVLPAKNVEKVTLRLGEGKALFIGALARLEVTSGRPFFFTSFFSPMVKIHPGRTENAGEFAEKHAGEMLTPPFDKDQFERLGEWTSKSFTAVGEGWKRSCMDIVLSGLGWISLTGVGEIGMRVCVPKGVGVFTREPLMPFETQSGASSYTGSVTVNRRQMNKPAKRRKRAQES